MTNHSVSAKTSNNSNPSLIRAMISIGVSAMVVVFTTRTTAIASRSKVAIKMAHSKQPASSAI